MKATQALLNGDKELLKTGFFSDVKVVCDDKTWALHKNILCTRRVFFKKALKATPDLAALLVDNRTMAGTCVRLFTIADYFELDRLSDMVATVLSDKHLSMAKKVQLTGKPAKIPNDFVDGFFQAAATAYSRCPSSSQPLRNAFVEFFKLTRFVVLQEPRFRARLQEIPELSHDILMSLVSAGDNGRSMVLFENPNRCQGCGWENISFFPQTWVECDEVEWDREENRWEGIGPKEFCERCAPLEKVPDAFPPLDEY
ncbi:hypothetical protein DL764_009371 [Monosporascus ibericus]|uniref:BTB domain-containing protein n=1 Tax=Monosporascus ibericus TaxID=155417 RepID=A0A4Q4SV78_9PEZI|nr:hypothetical protein DL764_009371 [Monosporascus ibericus]